jgi:hypothetical protein
MEGNGGVPASADGIKGAVIESMCAQLGTYRRNAMNLRGSRSRVRRIKLPTIPQYNDFILVVEELRLG